MVSSPVPLIALHSLRSTRHPHRRPHPPKSPRPLSRRHLVRPSRSAEAISTAQSPDDARVVEATPDATARTLGACRKTCGETAESDSSVRQLIFGSVIITRTSGTGVSVWEASTSAAGAPCCTPWHSSSPRGVSSEGATRSSPCGPSLSSRHRPRWSSSSRDSDVRDTSPGGRSS